MAFGKRAPTLNISIDDTPINQEAEIKYLGRIVAASGSNMPHVVSAVDKVTQTCSFLLTLRGCRFGVDPKRSLQFYKVYARAKIEYAASSFANLTKTALNKFRICINAQLRRSLGLIKSTPVHVLYHMAGELQPESRLELRTAKDLVNIFHRSTHLSEILPDIEKPIDTSIARVFNKYKQILMNVERQQQLIRRSPKIAVMNDFYGNSIRDSNKNNINPQIIEQLYLQKRERLTTEKWEMIFTDASIMDGNVVGALYHEGSANIQRFRLPFLVSSMTAELVTMMKAVEYATGKGFRRIAILTDSKSGCFGLERPGDNDICIKIHNMIEEARNIELVEFHYIPPHKGILGNSIVD